MIRWGAHRPAVVWAMAAGLIVAGGVAFSKLPLATRSTIEFPTLQVSAGWYGATPELVETYITSPIEAAVQGLRGVRRTSSMSSANASSVQIELDPHTDVALARLAVLERLESLRQDLPRPAQSSLAVSNYVPPDLRQTPLLEINVVGPYTPGTLARIVEDVLQPRLVSVAGISQVIRNGGADTRITVAYDPTLLRQLAIDPSALATAINQASQDRALGQITRGVFALSVSVHDQPRTIADIARLPVVTTDGRTFTLGQLASIRPEENSNGAFYRLNGQTAVSLSLFRQAGADAIKTAHRARAVLPALQAQMPPGVRLEVSSDESTDLEHKLDDLMLRGGIAFGSVFLVLLIALWSVTGSFLVIGSAAIAIAAAALSLYLLHIPANMLTLAGLGMGIGILVQNGLVVVERLRGARNTADGRAEAGSRIAPAVLGSTLTTTVVLLPFLYLQGNAKAVFAPFAAAFALALFWSVGTALVFVPAVGRGGEGRHRGWPRLARLYQRMVAGTLRWRYLTFGLTAVAVAVLTWGFIRKVPRVTWSYGWGEMHTSIDAQVTFPRGSDPAQVEQLVSELERVAVGFPGVSLVRSQGDGRSGNVHAEFTAAASASNAPWELSDRLTERAALIGGTDNVSVTKPVGPGFYNGSGGGSMMTSQIRLMGYSFEGLLQLAMDLQARLERIPRVRQVSINSGSYGSERAVSVSLEPDRLALARAGATVANYASSVQQQLNNASGGTTLHIGNDEVEVLLRAAGPPDRDIRDLSDATIYSSTGAPLRIGNVSSVGEVEGMSQIQREDQQYIRFLSYDFRGPQKLADRTHKAFMASITTPPGYVVTDDLGYNYRSDDSGKALVWVFVLGIVLVLLAVALVFNSVWAAGMVLLALPLALGGVVAAFWITGTAFNREAAVGVILVVGLAVNHSILLIDAALRARREHGDRLTREAVLAAATDRVTMIVLVTLTTMASLLPMAVGTKADDMFGAIALATAGGTIAGTLGVMFLLPPMLLGWRRLRPDAPTP